jgi:hypothetical protein
MGVKRQHVQLELAFMTEGRGEAPSSVMEGSEALVASRDSESPAAVH